MRWRVALALLVTLLAVHAATAQDRNLRLHAWDGKSDPSKDPVFEYIAADGTYVVRNQKCYPGMEFGVYYFPGEGDRDREWLAGIWEDIIPGVTYELVKRDTDHPTVNFKILREGTYDFVLDFKDNTTTSDNLLGALTVNSSGDSPAADGLSVTGKQSYYSGTPRDRSWKMLHNAGGGYSFVYDPSFGALEAEFVPASGDSFAKIVCAQDADCHLMLVNLKDEAEGGNEIVQVDLATNDYETSKLKYHVKYRQAGSSDEFQTLENVSTYYYDMLEFDKAYGICVGMVDLPANSEFYLSADIPQPEGLLVPSTLDILPLSAETARTDYMTQWDAAPRGFGAPGNLYFTTTEAYHGILRFNPSTMQLRLEVPGNGPWTFQQYKNEFPEKLYLHGQLPLDGNPIDDWGGYHQELSADLSMEGSSYQPQACYYFDNINLTDDAWFRIFTEDDAVTGGWTILGSLTTYTDQVRGCWAPSAPLDVDVPASRLNPVGSWAKITPDEGFRWHLPAGNWNLVVKWVSDNLYSPNCLQLYAYQGKDEDSEYSVQLNCGNYTQYALSLDENGNYSTTAEIYNYAGYDPEVKVSLGRLLGKNQYGNPVQGSFVVPCPEGESLDRYGINAWAELPLNVPVKVVMSTADVPVEGGDPWMNAAPGERDRYKFVYDPAAGTLMVTRDYDGVNLPLKPADFTDAAGNPRPHYFLVGSRTADFRLQPEWELTAENGYALKDRLMYPGMFGIARVDSYDDYMRHKFKMWYVREGETDGKVIDAAGDYALSIDTEADGTILKAGAIKEYGDYYSYHSTYSNPWPYIAFSSMKSASMNTQKIASWWHFNGFRPEAGAAYTRELLAASFKKGTPSLASSIGITLDADGNPATLNIGEVATWENDKDKVLGQVAFYMVGTDFINERPLGHEKYMNPQATTLFTYTNVTDWANQWIQYELETGRPYVDADGKYLFQTVYQDSWMKSHPTLFYRAADNTVYDSNSLRLRSLREISAAGDDKFEGYYRDMRHKTLGDGSLKKYTDADAPVKYDFYDQVGAPDPYAGMGYRKGDIDAPEGEGWLPYALSDLTFGGWFKVWSGFGGGHEGFGSWTDHVEIGDAYAWFNMNVGHSMARNPLRVKAGGVEMNASASTLEEQQKDDRLVNFYLTGKDDPAADFMTREVDGTYPLRTYKRLILWLNKADRTDLTDNSTSGMAKSYVQLVVSDLSPVIKARQGQKDLSVTYAWNLTAENIFDDKIIREAIVTVYRDGEAIGTYPQPEAAGKRASECTGDGMFSGLLEDCEPGEYWMKVDVTYTDEVSKDALSNHIYLYDRVYPVLLTAWQKTEVRDGRARYGFNVYGSVSLPEADEKRPVAEYTDAEGNPQRLTMKEIVDKFTLSYKSVGSQEAEMDVVYTPGEASDFRIVLDGRENIIIKARPVAKASPLTVNGISVELTAEQTALLDELLASEVVELTLPYARANVGALAVETVDFDPSVDIPTHPGHTDTAPVRYRKVNSMTAALEIVDDILLENIDGVQETVDYSLTGTSGRPEMNGDGITGRLVHMGVQNGWEGLTPQRNTLTVKSEYRRGEQLLKDASVETVIEETKVGELITPEYNLRIDAEDIAVRGTRQEYNGKKGMLCEVRVYVPGSINYAGNLPGPDLVCLAGFDRPSGLSLQTTPVVKGPEDMKGGFLLIDAKHADEFMGLEGTTIGGNFLEWDGTQTWCESHDWAHAAARESFALSFPAAVFYEGEDFSSYRNVTTPQFTVKTYNVYPFLVETPSAASQAPARAAAADPDKLVFLQQSGRLTVPQKNWNDKVFTGIGEAYGPAEGPVDVYTTTGRLVMRGVTRAEALRTLQPGLYLIGNEKIMVK